VYKAIKELACFIERADKTVFLTDLPDFWQTTFFDVFAEAQHFNIKSPFPERQTPALATPLALECLRWYTLA
jgi:hypothetical protein